VPPKKPFTTEQQQFIDHLVEDVGHRIAEILIQRGIGAVQQAQVAPPPQSTPPPYQKVQVTRMAANGGFAKVDANVPQLLAEQNDHLIMLIQRMDTLIQTQVPVASVPRP
jgi:hypothetical protein